MELGRSNSKSDWEVWNWVGTTKKSDWEVWNLMGATKNPTRRCGTWWEQQKNPHSQTSTKKSKLTNIYKKIQAHKHLQKVQAHKHLQGVTDLVNMTLLTHYCQSRRLNLGAMYDQK